MKVAYFKLGGEMDINTTILIIIAIFAVVAITAFFMYRSKAKVEIKGPSEFGLKIDASNETPGPTPAIKLEDAKSSEGGILMEDSTSRGIDAKRLEAKGDILASSRSPAENPKQ
jgi:hypothetical protein